jgi:uncharacterized protein (DUF362 family)/Pyruvate/2-oxoacid:ferredoxin oxidoreductase delta subunit
MGYGEEEVADAIRRGFALLGGAERFSAAGEQILLKPNLLAGSTPDELVCPHPSVFRAVARELNQTGARLVYGDSPGFGNAQAIAKRAGIAAAAATEGVEYVDFRTPVTRSFPEGRLIRQFTVAAPAFESDGIISISKLKTHGLTRMTGAIKNTFGCVPGLLKGEFHVRMGTTEKFSEMLVDLNRFLRPRLYIMDAVIAMEGNGPRGGDARRVAALLMSDDPVALDATACRMIALDIDLVPPVRIGDAWGLGHAAVEAIQILGDDLSTFIEPTFVVDRRPRSTKEPGFFGRLLKDQIVPKPVIERGKCETCGVCVNVCPVQPKAVDFVPGAEGEPKTPPVYSYDRCIRCYSCQELCPEKAIRIVTPPLGRLLHR